MHDMRGLILTMSRMPACADRWGIVSGVVWQGHRPPKDAAVCVSNRFRVFLPSVSVARNSATVTRCWREARGSGPVDVTVDIFRRRRFVRVVPGRPTTVRSATARKCRRHRAGVGMDCAWTGSAGAPRTDTFGCRPRSATRRTRRTPVVSVIWMLYFRHRPSCRRKMLTYLRTLL